MCALALPVQKNLPAWQIFFGTAALNAAVLTANCWGWVQRSLDAEARDKTAELLL
jgi:hypothetical protein